MKEQAMEMMEEAMLVEVMMNAHKKAVTNNAKKTNRTDSLEVCIKNCEQSRQKITSTFIAIFLPLFFIIPIASITLCCIWPRLFRRFTKSKQLKNLKRMYNTIDQSTMALEIFQSRKNLIVQLLNECGQGVSEFFFMHIMQIMQPIQKYKCSKIIIQTVAQKPFITELKIRGEDYFGQWTANAFILNRSSGLFFWMLKEYKDTVKAGQTGAFQYQIYESTDLSQQIGIFGKWFYRGFQNNGGYRGYWQIIRGRSLPFYSNLNNFSCDNTQIKIQ